MKTTKKKGAGLAGAAFALSLAIVAGSALVASPAQAQDWHHHGGWDHGWHHGWDHRWHHPPPGYYGGGYGYAPPPVYAPPPPAYYGAPGINVVIPIR